MADQPDKVFVTVRDGNIDDSHTWEYRRLSDEERIASGLQPLTLRGWCFWLWHWTFKDWHKR